MGRKKRDGAQDAPPHHVAVVFADLAVINNTPVTVPSITQAVSDTCTNRTSPLTAGPSKAQTAAPKLSPATDRGNGFSDTYDQTRHGLHALGLLVLAHAHASPA
jgi:hypothetical protein